jgi:hypothetical protein
MKTFTDSQKNQLARNLDTLDQSTIDYCSTYFWDFCNLLEVPDEIGLFVMRAPVDVCDSPQGIGQAPVVAETRKLRRLNHIPIAEDFARNIQREIREDLSNLLHHEGALPLTAQECIRRLPSVGVLGYSFGLYLPPFPGPMVVSRPEGPLSPRYGPPEPAWYIMRYAKKVWREDDELIPNPEQEWKSLTKDLKPVPKSKYRQMDL